MGRWKGGKKASKSKAACKNKKAEPDDDAEDMRDGAAKAERGPGRREHYIVRTWCEGRHRRKEGEGCRGSCVHVM